MVFANFLSSSVIYFWATGAAGEANKPHDSALEVASDATAKRNIVLPLDFKGTFHA
jgi:hypothetical protein